MKINAVLLVLIQPIAAFVQAPKAFIPSTTLSLLESSQAGSTWFGTDRASSNFRYGSGGTNYEGAYPNGSHDCHESTSSHPAAHHDFRFGSGSHHMSYQTLYPNGIHESEKTTHFASSRDNFRYGCGPEPYKGAYCNGHHAYY